MSDTTWHMIGKVSDIPRLGARCILTPIGRIAVFRTAEDEIFATEDRCPHRNGPLAQGIVHDTSVTCPLHNAVISLKTGEMTGPDEGRIRTFATRVDRRSETIEICLDEVTPAFAEAAE